MYKLSTLLEQISTILKLPENTFEFETTKINDQMEQYKNSRIWFGGVGLSTNILLNNA